jgi:hypothetical protein
VKQAEIDAGGQRLIAEARAYRLSEIRRRQHTTQVDDAKTLQIGTFVNVLTRYVAGLGGTLKLIADFARGAAQGRVTGQEPSAPLRFSAIIDEAVLHRRTGGDQIMHDQLRHLNELGKLPNITIQVLPFGAGWHPGTSGSFAILTFPEEVHSPVAYVESQAGEMYLEREDELRRVTLMYTYLHKAALSASESRELIAARAENLA